MLFLMLKRTWLYRKFDGIRNLIFEIMARVESRQAHHGGLLGRIEQQQLHSDTTLGRIEQRQLYSETALTSLSANDTSVLEGLLHLVQRAPADNALAESRQAGVLREIRERSDANSDQLLALARRLGKIADREDYAALAGRMNAFEGAVSKRLDALDQRAAAQAEAAAERNAAFVRRMEELDRTIAAHLDALNRTFGRRLDELNESIASAREGLATQSDLAGRMDALDRTVAARLDAFDGTSGRRLDQLNATIASAREGLATQSDLALFEERLDGVKGALAEQAAEQNAAIKDRMDELDRTVAARFDAFNGTSGRRLDQLNERIASAREGLATQSDLALFEARLDGVKGALAQQAAEQNAAITGRIEELDRTVATHLDASGRRLNQLDDTVGSRFLEVNGLIAERFKSLNDAFAPRLEAVEQKIALVREGLATQSDLALMRDRFDRFGRAVAGELETSMQERLASLEASMEARFDGIEVAVIALRERVVPRSDTIVHAGNGHDKGSAASAEPELALIAHLAPLLPTRVALDIGANVGAYSAALLDAGFAVHAFEPNPVVLDKLRARLHGRAGFSAHGFALGSADGKQPLHLLRDVSANQVFVDASFFSTLGGHPPPDGLEKAGDIEVPVRSLDSLQTHGLIPSECSYVKIDTEGFDLEVVRGMGTGRYPMVSVEFWDKNLPLGQGAALNGLSDLVDEMQKRGYGFWIVLYRVWGDNKTVRFYSNNPKTFDRSWGNAFFFQDHALFAEAQRWCATNLPAAELPADVPAVKKSTKGAHAGANP